MLGALFALTVLVMVKAPLWITIPYGLYMAIAAYGKYHHLLPWG